MSMVLQVTGVGTPIIVQSDGKWSYTPTTGWPDAKYDIAYTVSDRMVMSQINHQN